MNAAIVPIRSLSTGKSRLEGVLGRAQLERLCLSMMEDVLTALLAVPALDRVVVATPDRSAGRAAEALGAEAFVGDDPGLNAAVDAACRRLSGQGVHVSLSVLGDVAAAESDDFARLLAETIALAKESHGEAVGLAPSDDGGTAALVRSPADVVQSRFGHDSAAVYRAQCKAFDIRLCELRLPSLRLDLDEIADIEAFLAGQRARLRGQGGAGQSGARTFATLEEIGWSERLREYHRK